jgi:sigma-B regulation protein RsbU (phosphoserine phosphatase)
LATFRKKLKKAFLLIGSAALFIAVFVIDVVNWSADLDTPLLNVSRDVFVIAGFIFLYFLIESLWKRDQSPVKKLGFALILTLVVGIAALLLSLATSASFEAKGESLIPSGFDAILLANLYGVVIGSTVLLMLLILRDIIMVRRKKGTRRNFLVFLALMLATASSTLPYKPLESTILASILFGVTIAAIVVNSFRLSWIVYLTKREKLFAMAYAFVLFCIFIGLFIITLSEMTIGKALLFYSRPLRAIISLTELFGAIYFGMAFLSTLFHLPTAEAFDRKNSEVTSLHNLSRLVTQVFDFNELVDTVTKMTLEVCEAKSSWLEILSVPMSSQRSLLSVPRHDSEVVTAALKNISEEETQAIMSANGSSIRKLVLDSQKPIVIDNVKEDRRTQHLAEVKNKFNSMVIVPLLSHETVIGILYATKEMAFGFDKEDVELISAFADQATIAIENSRLIEKSLERERLMREMLLAQDMQRKLLPQQLPVLAEVEIEALSTPAFEVGGDYYDFTMLDEYHLGVLVGDVSGKGVSAAFYMAEMKGIFQSLSKIYQSPREFLSKAHEALIATIDKRSFISLIYAVLDIRDGTMTIARAGHCPLLHVSRGQARYVKPQGLGLGMGTSAFFESTITEETLRLSRDDVVVMYTDGVTEAHPKSGDEFGYDRLKDVVRSATQKSAVGVRDAIIMAVDKHMNHESPEDDLTIVVLQWMKQ